MSPRLRTVGRVIVDHRAPTTPGTPSGRGWTDHAHAALLADVGMHDDTAVAARLGVGVHQVPDLVARGRLELVEHRHGCGATSAADLLRRDGRAIDHALECEECTATRQALRAGRRQLRESFASPRSRRTAPTPRTRTAPRSTTAPRASTPARPGPRAEAPTAPALAAPAPTVIDLRTDRGPELPPMLTPALDAPAVDVPAVLHPPADVPPPLLPEPVSPAADPAAVPAPAAATPPTASPSDDGGWREPSAAQVPPGPSRRTGVALLGVVALSLATVLPAGQTLHRADAPKAPTGAVVERSEPVTEGVSPDSPVWDRLAGCESSGRWDLDTGNGFYGGLQFTQDSWEMVGGSGQPHHAPREEQIRRAVALQDIQGWGAWPGCAAALGLGTP